LKTGPGWRQWSNAPAGRPRFRLAARLGSPGVRPALAGPPDLARPPALKRRRRNRSSTPEKPGKKTQGQSFDLSPSTCQLPAPVTGPVPWTTIFRKAALDYHRIPRPGKLLSVGSYQAHGAKYQRRDLALGLFGPGLSPAPCERPLPADPGLAARDLHRARYNLVRRHHQRPHRRAGLGNIGPPGLQAGDGGQGRSSSRNSPASTCSEPGKWPRLTSTVSSIIVAAAGADLRRHQPGRHHKAAGMLHHREEAGGERGSA